MAEAAGTGAGAVLLVTGGCGFIGSNFVRWWLENVPGTRVVVYDKLTYAGRRENLAELWDRPDLHLMVGDIADLARVRRTCLEERVTTLVNFAAESHVDQSIAAPLLFTDTNVRGTHALLEVARELGLRFHQVSTDEVYGDVPAGERRAEGDPLAPRSPYAASKAAADHLALAYHATYALAVTVTRGSNTVGPYQYPEKVLPLFATSVLRGEPLPLYGDGLQQRDYMHVRDHCAAIAAVLRSGQPGEVYNVGTGTELTNLDLACAVLDTLGGDRGLIRHVGDRPGHDRRYAVATGKVRALGWLCRFTPIQAVTEAARWYAENGWWWRPIREGDFREYYRRQYAERLTQPGKPEGEP
ncbi:dTDP-glucose 4,6-dehydratase (plasmid) [Deinococcus metallilatus]|uniref:dTDP-glucose 4,6-dehydratase n=1 Tax=Deinococcus metallilatus TaxID=1211322 RepID=A0ABR6MYE3_9DEIO|nr:dTDP-glucose 4,6-dehydratase [Deinococcus metallilatus]MBB5296969.1 dTDP-glucose 4,6-dehydratase [Deinococcus metallilatus]QBY06664.1 dTDP-glucose 4,6-dehydratase [Deinococcus metallilatus]GMA15132.1 dTDP-glucose 4,6-dehydratase [Deinococcus metallilatus]